MEATPWTSVLSQGTVGMSITLTRTASTLLASGAEARAKDAKAQGYAAIVEAPDTSQDNARTRTRAKAKAKNSNENAKLNPTFLGTNVTDDLRANNTVRSNSIQSYDATRVTVNDNIAVTGTLAVDTVTSKTVPSPVVVSDGLTVHNTLAVDNRQTLGERGNNQA